MEALTRCKQAIVLTTDTSNIQHQPQPQDNTIYQQFYNRADNNSSSVKKSPSPPSPPLQPIQPFQPFEATTIQQQQQTATNLNNLFNSNSNFDNMSTLNSCIYDNDSTITINELRSFALEYVKHIVSRASELAQERQDARNALKTNSSQSKVSYNGAVDTNSKEQQIGSNQQQQQQINSDTNTTTTTTSRSRSSFSKKKHRTWMLWSILLSSCCIPSRNTDSTIGGGVGVGEQD